MTEGTGCIVVGLVASVLALFLSIGGPTVVPPLLEDMQQNGLKDSIVIDSTSATQYSNWAGEQDTQTPYLMGYYVWNLSNPDDVVSHGAKPDYTCLGPYVYRRYRTSVNVSFPDDGNKIRYQNYREYVFDQESSNGNETDIITNFSPTYLGAVSQTKNEMGLFQALSPEYIKLTMSFLTGEFIPVFGGYQFPTFFSPMMNETVTNIQIQKNVSYDDAMDLFLNDWANAVQAPTYGGNWTGLLVSVNSVNGSAGISLPSARSLMDPLEPYSLLSPDPDSAWAWPNSTFVDVLMTTFNLTSTQVNMLVEWRYNVYLPLFVYPTYVEMYKLGNISDLGWQQWYNGAPLGGLSTMDLWGPELPNIGYPWELWAWLWGSDQDFVSWDNCKKVMDVNTGLLNVTNFQAWLKATTNHDGNPDFSEWGLTTGQSDGFGYYTFNLGALFAPTVLTDLYGPTGGLIRTKSARDWIFECDDYIFAILRPDGPSCSPLQNSTSFPATLAWSGKDDIDKANTYIEWREQEVLNDTWNGPLNVSGYHTEMGQFKPALDKEPVYIFDSNIVRPVRLTYSYSTDVKEIPVDRYYFDWFWAFNFSDFYYTTFFGFANLTSSKNQAPIFVSLWDMMEVPNRTLYVNGLANYTSIEEYNTVIDVEPITGKPVQSRSRMQVNMYMKPRTRNIDTDMFFLSPFGNNPPGDIFVPFMKTSESVTINDDQAQMLNKRLKMIPRIKEGVFWAAVTVGPALGLLGVVMVVVGLRRRAIDKQGYQAIDDVKKP